MITRLWHGYTTPENADAFAAIVKSDIIPRFERVPGFQGAQLLRRDLLHEVEFVALTFFDSLESVRAVAGEDFGQPVLPDAARDLLTSFDKRTSFYSVIIDTTKD
jgi:hypothetical protein